MKHRRPFLVPQDNAARVRGLEAPQARCTCVAHPSIACPLCSPVLYSRVRSRHRDDRI